MHSHEKVLSAVAIALTVLVSPAPSQARQPSQNPYAPRVVELGPSPALEDFSDVGQNLTALPNGDFAVVWVSRAQGFDGTATAGSGLLQFVDPNGKMRFSEPLVVAESEAGGVWSPAVIPDGKGGVFTAFVSQGEFSPGPGFDVNLTIQRVSPRGLPLWPGSGVEVSTDDPNLPVLIEDGNGGVYVCFSDTFRDGNPDIYCQHMDAAGHLTWGRDPLVVAVASGFRTRCGAITDGAGGIIVVWVESLDNITEIRAQRFNASGIRLWGDTGLSVAVTTLSNEQYRLRMLGVAADGAGGVVASYEDDAQGSRWDRRLLMQRFDGQGLPVWSQPVRLGAETEVSRLHEATVTDDAGNAYVISRVVGNDSSSVCRVNRVTPEGHLPWGRGGLRIADFGCVRGRAAFDHGHLSVVVSDSSGGRVFTIDPSGSHVGPQLGRPSPLPNSILPADVAWSTLSGNIMSVWERAVPPDHVNIDVVGVVRRLIPPPPRHPRRRAGG